MILINTMSFNMKSLRHIAVLVLAYTGCAEATSINTEDAAVDYTVKLIRKYNLTTINTDECLHYDVWNHDAYFLIRVRENHTPRCGGDPMTSPTVFFMKIWKHKDKVLTDAYDRQDYLPVKQAAKLLATERTGRKGDQ